MHGVDRQTGRALFHDESADALVAETAVLRRKHHDILGHGGIGDEHLAAVQEVGPVALDGGGLERGGVRSTTRLGQPKGGDTPAIDQGRQDALLLVIAAEAIN